MRAHAKIDGLTTVQQLEDSVGQDMSNDPRRTLLGGQCDVLVPVEPRLARIVIAWFWKRRPSKDPFLDRRGSLGRCIHAEDAEKRTMLPCQGCVRQLRLSVRIRIDAITRGERRVGMYRDNQYV